MQRLEVSCAVRRIYSSLGAKGLSDRPPYRDILAHRKHRFKDKTQITCDIFKFSQRCWKRHKFPGIRRRVACFRMSLLSQSLGFQYLTSLSLDHLGPQDEGSRILKRQENSDAFYEAWNDFRTKKKYSATWLCWPPFVPVNAAEIILVASLWQPLEPCSITCANVLFSLQR